VYETGVKVPLLVTDGQHYLEQQACEASGATSCTYSAGLITSPGRKVDASVQTLDLFATLGAAGGGTVSTGTDAVSFAPCFTSTSTRCVSTSRTLYTEAFTQDVDGTLASGMAAVRVQKNKLVAKYDAANACMTYELYALARDPFERRNLATVSSSATTLASLKTTLSGLAVPWMSGVASCGG
jgi:arylsulfatase A-like enzyme